MRILYDFQTLGQQYGGVSRYYYELYRNIPKIEKEIYISLPVAYANNHYFKDILNYRDAMKHGNSFINNITTVQEILKVKKQHEHFDIIHPTWNKPLYMRILPFLKKESKLVVTVHDLTHELIIHDSEEMKNNRKIFHSADGIIAVSENTKKDLLQVYPELNCKKIKVIYHGNSLTDISYKIDVPTRYILFVGTRLQYKNFEILIDVMSELVKKYNDLFLICAGGGCFSKGETNLLEKRNVTDRVIQRNVSDKELRFLYEKAECFVYPSLYEGFGIPILEAFASKCPVVLSDCSCFPEIARNAAVYFHGNDPMDLYHKIVAFLNNNSLKDLYREKGYKRGLAFCWEKAAEETYRFYKEILDA